MGNIRLDIGQWIGECQAKSLIHGNQWFKSKEMEIYVRLYAFNRELQYFDIGNVNVKPKMQGKGYYGAFLDWLEEILIDRGITFLKYENVIDEWLAHYYQKRGADLVGIGVTFQCVQNLRNQRVWKVEDKTIGSYWYEDFRWHYQPLATGIAIPAFNRPSAIQGLIDADLLSKQMEKVNANQRIC